MTLRCGLAPNRNHRFPAPSQNSGAVPGADLRTFEGYGVFTPFVSTHPKVTFIKVDQCEKLNASGSKNGKQKQVVIEVLARRDARHVRGLR
jgi:hypothetical protein